MVGKIKNIFSDKFSQANEIISFSPGRINLIGEHTDYNKGFVLPAAIDKGVYAAIGKRKDNLISIHSCEFEDSYAFDLNNIIPSAVSWANYILGVAADITAEWATERLRDLSEIHYLKSSKTQNVFIE